MTQPQPAWMFWQPLSFWMVLLVMFVAQIAANLGLVALREGLGVPLPQWIAGGVGGLLGWVVIVWMAARRRARAT